MEIRKAVPAVAALVLAFSSALTFAAELLPKAATPEEVGFSSARLANIAPVMNKYVADGKLPGSVVLVVRKGKIAYSEAFGFRDKEAKAAMKTDSIFRIASQSKAVTSVAVMILQEQGKLVISDPVEKFLPAFKDSTVAVPREGGGFDVVRAKRPITIRDLLTHTAGISYGQGPAKALWDKAGTHDWYFADRNEPVGETIKRIAKLPFDAQPGEKWVYGYNTDILGALVEKVSGKTLDQFVHAEILDPLKMQDTQYYLDKNKRDRLTVVYAATEDGKFKRLPDGPGIEQQGAYVDGPRKSFSGGAGLLSTPNDYARLLQMLLNGGELDGVRILGRKTVQLMTTDHLNGIAYQAGEGFGLGFYVVKDPGARGRVGSVGEFGWGGAYHTEYAVDPSEQMVIVYMTQLRPTQGLEDYERLRAMIYQAIVD